MLAALAFYLFSFVLVVAAILVILARNPVHSVLFLILAFFNAAALFVLFLFVVMMLDIDFVGLRRGVMNYMPLGALLGLVVFGEFLVFILGPEGFQRTGQVLPPPSVEVSNTVALGRVLYTDYILYFQAAGMVLLVAMIGAIVLTLRHREGVKRQSISAQVSRRPQAAMDVVDVKPGQGVT